MIKLKSPSQIRPIEPPTKNEAQLFEILQKVITDLSNLIKGNISIPENTNTAVIRTQVRSGQEFYINPQVTGLQGVIPIATDQNTKIESIEVVITANAARVKLELNVPTAFITLMCIGE